MIVIDHFLKRTWAEIDFTALSTNYTIVRSHLELNCKLMAVVKADAYGHGDIQVALHLQKLGTDWFGVSNVLEAVSIRKAGVTKPILIFSFTPIESLHLLETYGLTQTVISLEYAQKLSAYAKENGVNLQVHIKINTGMNRVGINAYDSNCIEQIKACTMLPNLQYTGIFSHFAVADETDDNSKAYTQGQLACFTRVIATLKSEGITFELVHISNSAACLSLPNAHFNMVRPGILLYGIAPSTVVSTNNLQPVLGLFSTVSSVHSLKKGQTVSYGRTFTASKDSKIATIAIGYADGYRRQFSNCAYMIVNGQKANVIGTICMDQLMLDVTDISNVAMGDVVTVIGDEISVTTLAHFAQTIPYEIVCGISKRVQRIYK